MLDSIKNIIYNAWQYISEWFSGSLNTLLQWLYDAGLAFFQFVLDKVIVICNSFDVSFLTDDLNSWWSYIPDSAIHYLTVFKIPACFGIILGAMTIRFLLTFIPFIGPRS